MCPPHLFVGVILHDHNGIITVDDGDFEEDNLSPLEIVSNHMDDAVEERRLSLDSVELDLDAMEVESEQHPPVVSISNHKRLLAAKDHNAKLKKLVVKEVKRPGRSECLFFLAENVGMGSKLASSAEAQG